MLSTRPSLFGRKLLYRASCGPRASHGVDHFIHFRQHRTFVAFGGYNLVVDQDRELAMRTVNFFDRDIRFTSNGIRHTGGMLFDRASHGAVTDYDAFHDISPIGLVSPGETPAEARSADGAP